MKLIADLLRSFANWLNPEIVKGRDLTEIVLPLMEKYRTSLASGEWKAHQVMGIVKKNYPALSKADIRMEIELLYQEGFKD